MNRAVNSTSLIVFALLILCLSLLPGHTYETQERQGSIYYIALDGDDRNPGTIDEPWRDFNDSIYKMSAGDTLYVRAGTYDLTEGIWVPTVGTQSAPVVFAAYPNEKVILDGTNIPDGVTLLAVGGQYITIRNFEVRNSPDTGISVWGGSHVTIQGNRVHGSKRGAILAGHSSVGLVTDIWIDNNIVYNNALVNNPAPAGDGGGWPAIIMSMRATNVRFTNNRVYQNYGEGLDFLMTDGGLAEGNIAYDNYSINIYLDNARNIIVRNNLTYTTNDTRFYRYNHPAAGIQIANETYSLYIPSENNQIINNIIIGGRYGFYSGNYQTGGRLRSSLIANNTFYGGGNGIVYIDGDPGHSSTTFANNIFYQTEDAPIILAGAYGNTQGISNITFQNNLYYGGDPDGGAGVGDVLADPMLVNPGANNASDYQLKPDSPAIDTGADFTSVTTDYFGNPRTGSLDLGAHEYTSMPMSTPTSEVSSTPTPVVTPTGGIELLTNGDFETKNDAQKPDLSPWTVKNAVDDKIKCDKPGKDFSQEGDCAFRFKGGVGEHSQLSQTLTGTFALNDTLTLNLQLNASAEAAAGSIKLQVKYTDGTQKSQTKLKIEQTSGGYTPLTGSVMMSSTAIEKVQLKIKHTSASGKVYLDAVSVTHIANTSVLGLPQIQVAN